MPGTTEPHVIIVGAGVTGLTIAQGLQTAGIPYTILETEKKDRWRSKEWTFGLHWGLPLLESLLPDHLTARLVADASADASLDWNTPPNNGACIWDATTGEMLKDLTPEGRNMRVSRRKLRKLAQEGVKVEWGHTLQSVQCSENPPSVTITCTDGKQFTGTILVGADGPSSPVRDFLFDYDEAVSKKRSLERHAGFSMAISYDAETAKKVRSSHPVWCIGISPQLFWFQSIQDIVDPNKPETWKFFFFPAWFGDKNDGLDHAGRLRELKRRGEDLAEPFRTAVLNLPDDLDLSYENVSYWIANPWDTRHGLVTLAGDAAHPMPPYRGQGGNHAIQDSFNFVEIMKKIKAAPAADRMSLQATLIQEYSDEVAKRGAEETQLSIKNGNMCLSYHEFKDSPYMKQGLTRGKS